ncbi:ankyrin repeat domain-containing protein [Rhodococcoides fascians]|uniref:ankyrin repeat domain-containing protein n=1 Tax=Rhodococcoides fascians TaxID=1828 RepID=UPI000565E926|nr:ankyrin repeat domain-containing protein [Rhodococcus fascians]
MPKVTKWALPLLVALCLSGCAFEPLSRFFGADADKYFDDPRVIALLDAAQKGNLDEVRSLVEDGVDIESPSNDHDPKRAAITPLLWAVEFGSASTVTTLLEAGADARAQTVGGYNALNYAVLRDNIESVEALLNWDATLVDSPDRFGGNAVHGIALYGREDMLDVMIDAGASLDTRQTVSRQTPLFSAAAVNNVDMCLRLVKAGADAGLRNDTGETFLPSLFRTNDTVMNRDFLSSREKLVDEMRARGFPVETGR